MKTLRRRLRVRLLVQRGRGPSCALVLLPVILLTLFSAENAAADERDGSTAQVSDAESTAQLLYAQRCAACHDQPEDYVPSRAQLTSRSADDVLRTLQRGSMSPQVAGLTEHQVLELAQAGFNVYIFQRRSGIT